MGRPDFSVVVPFRNEERWLPACLEALRRQTLGSGRFEVILVDNGSTDSSLRIARKHPGAIVLEEPGRDPYLSRNRGIAAARAADVVFLDADCIPAEDWLEELAAVADADPAPIVLGYLGFPRPAPAMLLGYEHYYDQKLRHLLAHSLCDNLFGHAGNMLVRRKVFRDVGPFLPLPVQGDTELIQRVVGDFAGAPVAYAPRARVVHAEVATTAACLSKLFECGKYSQALTRRSRYRVVPLHERLRIGVGCVRERGYGPTMTLNLAGMLMLGWASFVAGRVRCVTAGV
ncbi:MAG: hypothetical protein QOE36_457 [Gaiellaceae bacterium]|nr:hypothetical protein [Gaiellaceae bacterium]